MAQGIGRAHLKKVLLGSPERSSRSEKDGPWSLTGFPVELKMRQGLPGETLGQRIREIRGNRSQQSFARLLGIFIATLKRYENGERTPDAELVRRLCQEADLDPVWLLWGIGNGHPRKCGRDEGRNGPHSLPEPADHYIRIPHFPHTLAKTTKEASPVPHAHIAFSSQWLLQRGLDPGQLCFVEALGDAMAPSIPEGALLLVSTETKGGLIDGVYLLRTENRLLPKRIQPEWQGGVLLRSDNPTYEDQHLGPAEAESLVIFGQVVWMGQPLL